MMARQLQTAFAVYAARRGYVLAPPAPLLSTDARLLFTNSTIVPYKVRMLRGEHIEPCAQIQLCFRANVPVGLPHSFTMLGLLAGKDALLRVVGDAAAFLRARAYPREGTLLALACAEDADLIDAWQTVCDDPFGALQFVPPVKAITRWGYGEGGRLTGRGLSLLWKNPQRPSHPGCNAGCGCGRFQALGTVIIITESASGESYVEAAIGLDGLLATRCNGDLLATPDYARLARVATKFGCEEYQARVFADDVISLTRLLAAGCQPSARGAGYILRRIIRRIDPLLLDALEVHSLIDPATLQSVRLELDSAAGSQQRCISTAKRFINARRGATIDPATLQATFGLSDETTAALLQVV